jgi:hypothetical protein
MKSTPVFFAFFVVPLWALASPPQPAGEAERPTSRTARPVPHITPPEVKRGDKVAVTVTSGGVLLTFETEAESSAHIGETVIVRNPENGRRFVARVEDTGKVVVKK